MAEDPTHIAAWQRLDAKTTTSGRLAAEDIPALAGIGVRHVINLALSNSPGALSGEDDLVAAHGLAYTHIPVPFVAPEERHFAEFCRVIESAVTPVHVHCIMNWRVSAFYYRYHRDIAGMNETEARALMEQQWSPETGDYPHAPTWARFIAAR